MFDEMETENEEERIFKIAKAGISYVEKHINSDDKEYFYNGLYKIWRYLIGDEDKKIEFLLQEDVQGNIIKLIDSLSEDGKLEFLSREQDNAIKRKETMERLSDDNRKALEGLSGLEFRKEVIKRIGDAEKKLSLIRKDEYLGNTKETYDKDGREKYIENILSSINDESIKIKGLDLIEEEYRVGVINSLDKDDKKMEVMEKMITKDYKKYEIVIKLDKDENKIKFLDNMVEWQKYFIIKTLNEENKVKVLYKLEDENDKKKIVESLSEENIVKSLEYLKEETKMEFVIGLSDVNKLRSLKYLKKESKEEVVNSFDIDEIIKTFEQVIDNKEEKIIILESILENIEEEYNRYSILKKLSDDSLKVQFLSFFDEDNKMLIIENLKEDSDKIKALHELKDEYDKAKIICTLEKDKDKISLLNEVDEQLKVAITLNLQNSEKKEELVSSFIEKENNHKYTDLGLPPEMTIGAEIEAEEKESKTNQVLMETEFLNWNFKGDGSLQNGIETVSPIMHNTPKDVESIYTITNLLKQLGFDASERCGGHVHIGADYLKKIDEIKELLEIWGSAEKNYFLISNKPGELPRKGVQEYAQPISDKIEKSELGKDDETEFVEDAKKVQDSRYSAINLMNVNNEKNTIEFRLSNGTNDPNIWIENIRLYGKTVQMAHEISQIKSKLKKGQELTDKEVRKLECKKLLKEDISLDEKMDALMELLFEENEREAYYERYEANKKLGKETEVLKDLKFGKVDFGMDDYKQICENTLIPDNIVKLMQKEFASKSKANDKKIEEDRGA